MELWFDAYENCHNAADPNAESGEDQRVAWPDGRSYADQDNITIEVFSLIRTTRTKVARQVRESRRKRGGGKHRGR